MPIYEYECNRGHRTERILSVTALTGDEPKETKVCGHPIKTITVKDQPAVAKCGHVARLVPSRTGQPILKAGSGGFYKPNSR